MWEAGKMVKQYKQDKLGVSQGDVNTSAQCLLHHNSIQMGVVEMKRQLSEIKMNIISYNMFQPNKHTELEVVKNNWIHKI